MISIIPEFYGFSIQELENIVESENDTNNKPEIDIDYKRELETLKIALIKNGYNELNPIAPKPFLDGELTNNLRIGDYSEAFFVINIRIKDSDVFQTRDAVEKYAFELYKSIATIRIDINSFVLSIFVEIEGDKQRNIFMRLNRKDLKELILRNFTAKDFVNGIENKLFDELYRDL
ncbi:hypothetical protein [Persicobacter diffluens]|uniref:hypothetical protein n=1 Tax=Persicobacter diffluens TaxID=981 RepID=UPI0030C72DAD